MHIAKMFQTPRPVNILSVCVCVCEYIHIFDQSLHLLNIYIYVYIYIYHYMYIYTHTHTLSLSHTCICIYVCIYIYSVGGPLLASIPISTRKARSGMKSVCISPAPCGPTCASAYGSICQHTLAHVSIRQHTSAYGNRTHDRCNG